MIAEEIKPLTEQQIKENIERYEYIRDNTKSEITKKLAERRIEALKIKLEKGDY